jgi:hypothetical protein
MLERMVNLMVEWLVRLTVDLLVVLMDKRTAHYVVVEKVEQMVDRLVEKLEYAKVVTMGVKAVVKMVQ